MVTCRPLLAIIIWDILNQSIIVTCSALLTISLQYRKHTTIFYKRLDLLLLFLFYSILTTTRLQSADIFVTVLKYIIPYYIVKRLGKKLQLKISLKYKTNRVENNQANKSIQSICNIA